MYISIVNYNYKTYMRNRKEQVLSVCGHKYTHTKRHKQHCSANWTTLSIYTTPCTNTSNIINIGNNHMLSNQIVENETM